MQDVVRHERRYSVTLLTKENLKNHFPSFIFLAMLYGVAQLPLCLSRWLGAGFGLLAYWANGKRRKIARINLAMCFPEMSQIERDALLRRHYIAAGKSYSDLGFWAWASQDRIKRKTRVVGLEYFEQQFKQGKNVILLAPHCVGMNIGGSFLAEKYKLFSMVKAQKNPVLNWLLYRGRTRFQGRPILRQMGLRPVIRGLKKNVTFYYLPDEDHGDRHSVFAPFFGVPTATLPTLGRLAALTDAVALPCFTRLLPAGQGYEIIIKPPLTDFPSGDRHVDAAHMNKAMEQGIGEMPEQYMWTFKLFKTRPDGAPSPYG